MAFRRITGALCPSRLQRHRAALPPHTSQAPAALPAVSAERQAFAYCRKLSFAGQRRLTPGTQRLAARNPKRSDASSRSQEADRADPLPSPTPRALTVRASRRASRRTVASADRCVARDARCEMRDARCETSGPPRAARVRGMFLLGRTGSAPRRNPTPAAVASRERAPWDRRTTHRHDSIVSAAQAVWPQLCFDPRGQRRERATVARIAYRRGNFFRCVVCRDS
jgi:hypothetical protein